MEMNHLFLGLIGLLALAYGTWGSMIILDQKYATQLGNRFRKMFGFTATDPDFEKSYDRYTRGVGIVIFGFGIGVYVIYTLVKIYAL